MTANPGAWGRERAPGVVVLSLCLLLQLAGALTFRHGELFGDEPYYVDKAVYIRTHGALQQVSREALDVQDGARWGTADWRPQGYPLFLAAILPEGTARGDALQPFRSRVIVSNWIFCALPAVALLLLLQRAGVVGGRSVLAAVLIGLLPFPYEWLGDAVPESANLFLVAVGIVLMWLGCERRALLLFSSGCLCFSLTLLLRPEMVVLILPVAVCSVLAAWRQVAPYQFRYIGAAVAIFLLVLSVQAGYRVWATAKPGIYGPLRIYNGGAFAWTHTWLGTEKEGYDFVYDLRRDMPPHKLPQRAFGNSAERSEVEAIIESVRANGYSQAADEAFAQIARRRTSANPVRVHSLRAWNALHVWFNTETSHALLQALIPIPRGVRRIILGIILILRVVIILGGLAAGAWCLRRVFMRCEGPIERLAASMFAFVVLRTGLIAIVLNWKVHRYMTSAWLPMIFCACLAVTFASRRRRTRLEQVI